MDGLYGTKSMRVDQLSRVCMGPFKEGIGTKAVVVDNEDGTFTIFDREYLDNYFNSIKNNIEIDKASLFMLHKLYMNCSAVTVDKVGRISFPSSISEQLSDEVVLLGEGNYIVMFPSVEAFQTFKDNIEQSIEQPLKINKFMNL